MRIRDIPPNIHVMTRCEFFVGSFCFRWVPEFSETSVGFIIHWLWFRVEFENTETVARKKRQPVDTESTGQKGDL